MSRPTHFRHEATKELHRVLSLVADRGHSMASVFDDFLTACVCTMALGTMEEEYLEVARRYSSGEPGKRGVDRFAEAFVALVNGMTESGCDLLGDLFEGAITHGENGQFFTPEHVAELMAKLTDDGSGETVSDPACGSGRCLLAAARINPARKLYGTDLDHRCVKMATLNLALNGLRGQVTWGNTLTLEEFGYYAVGEMGVPGLIRWCKRGAVVEKAEPKRAKKEKAEQVGLFSAV